MADSPVHLEEPSSQGRMASPQAEPRPPSPTACRHTQHDGPVLSPALCTNLVESYEQEPLAILPPCASPPCLQKRRLSTWNVPHHLPDLNLPDACSPLCVIQIQDSTQNC